MTLVVSAAGATVMSLARLVIFVVLHLAKTDYDPIRDAVSDYAVGRPTWRLVTAMTWAGLLTWVGLANAVWTGLPNWSGRISTTIELLVLAAVFLVLPWFPTDLEGQRRTARGLIHYGLAVAWFALAYSLTSTFAEIASQRWLGSIAVILTVLHWIVLLALVALVAALIIRPLRHDFGLPERVFIGATTLFYLLVAVGAPLSP
ncbi:MAG: DUF998 domain-containing protein [Microlunatus sp.]|nr:DUF998 domain-containing protein [Microlunatus sp.]